MSDRGTVTRRQSPGPWLDMLVALALPLLIVGILIFWAWDWGLLG